MKNFFITFSCCLYFSVTGFAQQNEMSPIYTEKQESEINEQNKILKKLQNLKISGYIQTQYQWGQENASLKV